MSEQPPAPEVRVPAHVAHRDFGEQSVLLNLETGQYHGLNETGRRMFELLAAGASLDAVAARLAEEHEVPATEVRADLDALCEALAARGLVELDGRPPR